MLVHCALEAAPVVGTPITNVSICMLVGGDIHPGLLQHYLFVMCVSGIRFQARHNWLSLQTVQTQFYLIGAPLQKPQWPVSAQPNPDTARSHTQLLYPQLWRTLDSLTLNITTALPHPNLTILAITFSKYNDLHFRDLMFALTGRFAPIMWPCK